jgi:primase-polymerase (primpol)-like protein
MKTDDATPPRPPRPPEPEWGNIPSVLTVRPQWVCWMRLFINGRWTKVPFQPDGKKASVTDPKTWASFEDVQCAYYSPRAREEGKVPFDGIGFVLTADDPFCAFDFDKCRNPDTGDIDQVIASYIGRLNSYTEVSPSGNGIRVIVEARLPPRDRRIGNIEMYDNERFVSLTGHRLA